MVLHRKSYMAIQDKEEYVDYYDLEGSTLIRSLSTHGFYNQSLACYAGERRPILRHSGKPAKIDKCAISWDDWKCCIRDLKGQFICQKEVFSDDYFYYG